MEVSKNMDAQRALSPIVWHRKQKFYIYILTWAWMGAG